MEKHRYEHAFYSSKATLLIRHIHCLYTMEEKNGKPILFRDAFLAVHHDFIMAMGSGDGLVYCDKDTKIIDAYDACVVPGFIDAGFHFLSLKAAAHDTDHELLMQARRILAAMTAGGTTTIGLPPYEDKELQKRMSRVYESLRKLHEVTLMDAPAQMDTLLCHNSHGLSPKNQPFCISAGTHGIINDLFLAAKLYYHQTRQNPYEIVKAITAYPAAALRIENERGTLKPDLQADFVMLQCPDLETAFSALAPSLIARVYREGNCIWEGRLHQ
ncbi:MAG: hypothetical protein KH431_00540 [Erysipelotrichaceae bacterium]|nr:hypothetical protein [Erysipelotrichaceae bacterium]